MDLSIVAVVGSFLVSERILKPKTLIVVALTGLLSYDLMTKTHDPASLRVYRGPGLIAFTIMCAAYSLRMWRRNGVACDELIFLPGTKYGAQYASVSTLEYFQRRVPYDNNHDDSSEDIDEEMQPIVNHDEIKEEIEKNGITTRIDKNNTIPSVSIDIDNMDNVSLNDVEDDFSSKSTRLRQRLDSSVSVHSPPADSSSPPSPIEPSELELHMTESWDMGEDEHYAYAPSATTVLGGSLDLMIPVLFNFHLFTEATTHQHRAANEGQESQISPKILPLIFLTILLVRAVIPPMKRQRFWRTVYYTLVAPFFTISFRDAFVGDVMTSLSRPIQDLAFAIFYYAAVIKGLVTHKSHLDDVGDLLEHNSTLHNWVLPACAIIPLWLKYMQCIRLVHDHPHQRFSHHLPNAFKYLSAALIATYAMAHPKNKIGFFWRTAFWLCILYQIWWDTMIDWRLFQFVPSAMPPLPQNMQQHLLSSLIYSLRRRVIFVLNSIKLRHKRLYKNERFYWRVFWINVVLRFCWMLNFIPAHSVSITGEIVQTFSSDVSNYLAPILSAAEVIRRCLWCILLVEVESMKITDPSYSQRAYDIRNNDRHDEDDDVNDVGRLLNAKISLFSWLGNNLSVCVVQKLRVLEVAFWAFVFIGFVYGTVYKL